MAGSVARIPKETLNDGPTSAVAAWRAGVEPDSPVYQNTVLAVVPACSAVAVAKGGPATRCGGFELKKLLAAAIAESAGSAVCRLAAVSAGVGPMENWLAPGVADAVAWSEIVWVVPSGRVRPNCIESPAFGFVVRSAVIVAGEPGEPTVGPVTVAPVRLELTLASLNPNGEPATSSLIETVDPDTAGVTRRPSPSAPRSAWLRSEMTWV